MSTFSNTCLTVLDPHQLRVLWSWTGFKLLQFRALLNAIMDLIRNHNIFKCQVLSFDVGDISPQAIASSASPDPLKFILTPIPVKWNNMKETNY